MPLHRPTNRRRRVLAWRCVALFALAAQAYGAVPTRGPGVLFSPFYYVNAGEPAPRHLPSGEGSSWSGLWGPLNWTNPPATAGYNAYAQGVETVVDDPLVATTTPEASEFQRVQGIEQLPPLTLEGGGPASQAPLRPLPGVQAESIAPPPAGEGLADAESLGDEPDAPRLQFLRTATVLLEPGELQVDVGVVYTLQEIDFPSVVIDGPDELVLESTLRQRQLFVPLEFRLGITPRVQMFLSMPVGWSHDEFAIVGTLDEEDSHGGLGDITLGGTFLLFDGQGRDTDVVLTVAGTFPTSDTSPFLAGPTGFGQASLGNDLWAISADLLWIDNYDPIVVFYGIGYRHEFDREFNGVLVNPGEEVRAQLGVGFAVNSQVTLSTRFGASFITRDRFNGDSLEGSFREPMSLRFAATILRDCAIVEPFVDIGTTDEAASTSFGVVWTY